MDLQELLATLGSFIVGGAVASVSAYLQHRWTAKREDRRRAEDERANRIQLERDVTADLVIAIYDYVESTANIKFALERASQGAALDKDRIRQYQAKARALRPVLVRARLTLGNPAARPALDALHEQDVRMPSHFNLLVLGEPSSEFATDFVDFQRVIGESRVAIEEAALTYDGVLPARSRRARPSVRQRSPQKLHDEAHKPAQ